MPEQRPQSPGKHDRRRKWKRTVILALLLLAGGAIVNVAVAWGLALQQWPPVPLVQWPPPSYWSEIDAQTPPQVLANAEQDWMRRRHLDDWIGNVRYRNESATTGLRVTTYARTMEERVEGGDLWRIDCGLPMFSFSGLRDERGGGVVVPYRVTTLGFIINTLFYALLLWLLFFAPFAVRRMLRRRRGQCEKCAYPIGVSPVCTECGAAVRRDTVGATHHRAPGT